MNKWWIKTWGWGSTLPPNPDDVKEVMSQKLKVNNKYHIKDANDLFFELQASYTND